MSFELFIPPKILPKVIADVKEARRQDFIATILALQADKVRAGQPS